MKSRDKPRSAMDQFEKKKRRDNEKYGTKKRHAVIGHRLINSEHCYMTEL